MPLELYSNLITIKSNCDLTKVDTPIPQNVLKLSISSWTRIRIGGQPSKSMVQPYIIHA
jgi:hypothetical protein